MTLDENWERTLQRVSSISQGIAPQVDGVIVAECLEGR